MAAFAGRMRTEVGNQGITAQIAWAESVMNRAAARHHSIHQELCGSYYPTPNPGSSCNPAFIRAITTVWNQGIDITHGATGNASGSVGFGRGGRQLAVFGGEKFGVEGVDRNSDWVRNYRRLAANAYLC
jgi:hypothetical protein